MKKKLAQLLCYMFWISLASVIVLGILYFMELVPLYRFLDILSISFFISLAGITSRKLNNESRPKISATFDYLFLLTAFTPIILGRNYPAVIRGYAEWLFFLYVPLIAIAVIVISVARRNDKEGAFEECIAWIMVIAWSIFLGVCTWFSIMKGIYISMGAVVLTGLAAVTSIIIGFVLCSLIYCIICTIRAIVRLHRFAFGKEN